MKEQVSMERMKTSSTLVLTVGLVFWLTKQAKERGTSVSEIAREILESAMQEELAAA